MDNENYKKRIIEMLEQINDEAFLRRIYLILVVVTKEVV